MARVPIYSIAYLLNEDGFQEQWPTIFDIYTMPVEAIEVEIYRLPKRYTAVCQALSENRHAALQPCDFGFNLPLLITRKRISTALVSGEVFIDAQSPSFV